MQGHSGEGGIDLVQATFTKSIRPQRHPGGLIRACFVIVASTNESFNFSTIFPVKEKSQRSLPAQKTGGLAGKAEDTNQRPL